MMTHRFKGNCDKERRVHSGNMKQRTLLMSRQCSNLFTDESNHEILIRKISGGAR